MTGKLKCDACQKTDDKLDWGYIQQVEGKANLCMECALAYQNWRVDYSPIRPDVMRFLGEPQKLEVRQYQSERKMCYCDKCGGTSNPARFGGYPCNCP